MSSKRLPGVSHENTRVLVMRITRIDKPLQTLWQGGNREKAIMLTTLQRVFLGQLDQRARRVNQPLL